MKTLVYIACALILGWSIISIIGRRSEENMRKIMDEHLKEKHNE